MKVIIRNIITSIEIYLLIILIIVSRFFPKNFNNIYNLLYPETQMEPPYIVIFILVGVLIGLNVKFLRDILFPTQNNKVLLEYDKYKDIKITAYFGFFWNCACVFGIFIIEANKDAIINYKGIIISLVLSGLYCLLTMFIASNKIKEILERNI